MSNLTIRFVELLKDKAPLPSFRFTADTTVRTRNREPTVTGVSATDTLLLESGGANDYILLEVDLGEGAYIKGEL